MSWKLRTLGELVEPFSVRAKDYGGDTGLSFFGVSNEDGITKSKYAAEGKAEDYKIIEKGCFAYNPYRINVGSIAYLAEDEKGLISPAYVVFKPKDKTVEPELLLKFLKSSEGIRQIKLHARGTVRQALRFEDLCKIEINLPDYKEQRPIISRLSSIKIKSDSLLTELINQQDLLSQLRQSFLREAMQGKLVKQEPKDGHAKDLLAKIKAEKAKSGKKERPLPPIKPEEIPFEIPENWVWCRLGEIGETNIGLTYKPSQVNEIGIPVLRANNIQNHKIDVSDLIRVDTQIRESQFAKPGDILLCVRSGSSNLIGKSAIIEKGGMSFGAFMSIYRSGLNPYIFYFTMSNFFKQQIDDKKSTGINQLTQEVLKNIRLPLPPLLEQSRIVDKLKKLMNLCDDLQDYIHASRDLNELLLRRVLKEALAG